MMILWSSDGFGSRHDFVVGPVVVVGHQHQLLLQAHGVMGRKLR